MGGKPSVSQKSSLPTFPCINKSESSLYLICEKSTSKIEFLKSVRMALDSAIGYLPEDKMILVGGTDNLGNFTNKVHILNPFKGTSKICNSLPIPSKLGYLMYFKKWVYYAGQISSNDDTENPFVPGQLMRYSLKLDYWEIIPDCLDIQEKPVKKPNANKCLIKICDMHSPAVFLFKGYLYFVNSNTFDSKNRLRINSRIYKLNIKKNDYRVIEEKVRFPYKIKNPICIPRSNDVIFVGGLKGKDFSKISLSMSYKEKNLQFSRFADIPADNLDEHPALRHNNIVGVFAFPLIYVLKDIETGWQRITMLSIQRTASFSRQRHNRKDEVHRSNSMIDYEASKNRIRLSAEQDDEFDSNEDVKINIVPFLKIN